jgi:hypothetical protein
VSKRGLDASRIDGTIDKQERNMDINRMWVASAVAAVVAIPMFVAEVNAQPGPTGPGYGMGGGMMGGYGPGYGMGPGAMGGWGSGWGMGPGMMWGYGSG